MVQNIAIVGLDRLKAYEVAKMLASELDMFFFDALELFEFDNMPRTLPVIIKEYGIDFYRKKESGIISYASDFSNCVINLESGFSEKESNFDVVKANSLLVYLAEAPNIVKESIDNQEFATEEEKKFFKVSEDVLKERAEEISKNADVIVNASNGSVLKIVSEALRMIRNYYQN